MIETTTTRSVDIDLGAARQTLRVSLHDGPAGERLLTMAAGHGGGGTGDPFIRAPWMDPPLQIPADVLQALRDALSELDGAE